MGIECDGSVACILLQYLEKSAGPEYRWEDLQLQVVGGELFMLS